MSKSSNPKLKLMYLLKILMEKNRYNTYHTLTVPEMIRKLKKYDINAERKSIYDAFESLKTFGVDSIDIISDLRNETLINKFKEILDILESRCSDLYVYLYDEVLKNQQQI